MISSCRDPVAVARLRHLPGGAENVQRAWFGVPSHPWVEEKGHGADCTESLKKLLQTRSAVTWWRLQPRRSAPTPVMVDRSLVMTADNALTDEGVAQALRAHEAAPGEAVRRAQLVLTSPLTRAMQTTGLIVGAVAEDGKQQAPTVYESCWDALEERWWPTCGEDQWTRAEQLLEKLRALEVDRCLARETVGC
eukprot:Skav210482  [mRNA]  locus=scaffold737:715805:723415:- [translate_table: standard]